MGRVRQYIVCKPFNVIALPDDFPMLDISPIEVLPGILHAAELGQIQQAKNVLIMGQGVSGLIMTQVVHLFSPKCLAVTDLSETKLALARKYGATHAYLLPDKNARTMDYAGKDIPDGFDVVIPCLLEGDGIVGRDRRRRDVRASGHVRLHRRVQYARRLLQGAP